MSCPACGECEICIGGQCVSHDTPWTAWTPEWDKTKHCTTESIEQKRSRCLSSSKKTDKQTLKGTKFCCSSDSDCGSSPCKRCNQSTKRCENKTTSWTPAWKDQDQHCPSEEREQTRCVNGAEDTQTIKGTKDCPPPCPPQICTPNNKKCPDGTLQIPTGTGFKKCENGQVTNECVYTGGWNPDSCSNCIPFQSADDCPSSHPYFKKPVNGRGRCSKCRGLGVDAYKRGSSVVCCSSNPGLADRNCRRTVEVQQPESDLFCK